MMFTSYLIGMDFGICSKTVTHDQEESRQVKMTYVILNALFLAATFNLCEKLGLAKEPSILISLMAAFVLTALSYVGGTLRRTFYTEGGEPLWN